MDPSTQERFWEKVSKTDGCWEWLGGKTGGGYGAFYVSPGDQIVAHRASYELLVGPIPAGLQLDHTCHNESDCPGGSKCPHRACVNPDHLEPVTQRENVRRGKSFAAERARQTHCKRGHPLSGDNLFIDSKGNFGSRVCRRCTRERQRNYDRSQAAKLRHAPNQGTVLEAQDRFMSKVVWNGDEGECWEWTAGRKPNGYGWFGAYGTNLYAHRFSFEMFVGDIPDGLRVSQRCNNRLCVNPGHLETATRKAIGAKTRKSHCSKGHPLSGENLILEKGNRRACRQCVNDRQRARRERLRTESVAAP